MERIKLVMNLMKLKLREQLVVKSKKLNVELHQADFWPKVNSILLVQSKTKFIRFLLQCQVLIKRLLILKLELIVP